MAKINKNIVPFSSYITQELKNIIDFLTEREEITKVVFIKKAIRHFLTGNKIIDGRIMIQRGEPNYISRNALLTSYINVEQKKELEDIAWSQGATFSEALYQALLEYSMKMITINDTGFQIRRK
jgi:hypothetical protein